MDHSDACLSDSALRALIDGEASGSDRPAWEAHLAGCPECRARFARIREDAGIAATLVERLAPDRHAPDPALAYRRWRLHTRDSRMSQMKGASWMDRILGIRRRTAAVGAALVAIMALVIAFAPVATLADNVLNSFRVHEFAAITIPMDMVQQLSTMQQNVDPQTKQQMANEFNALGNFSTTLSRDSMRPATSIDQAKTHLGGSLLVPSTLPQAFAGTQPTIYLGDAGTAQYTLNVGKAEDILSRLSLTVQGLPDAQTTPDVTFTLDVPASAVLDYQAGGKRLVVGQMQSPTLNIPSTVDINALRDSILQIPGLPADLVAQIRAVKDWQRTLIIPVPAGATTSQKTINGAPALQIVSKDGAVVLWQKDGVLYAVGGQGLTGNDVMSVASSMK